MGWFAGYLPRPRAPLPPHWPPPGGRVVWDGRWALSALGAWAPYEFHMVRQRDAELAVFGPCFASAKRIAEDFACALRAGRYESLTCWPGSYAMVVSDPGGVTILTDLAGQYPVCFTTDQRGVAYCSLARPLADRRDAEPDTEWLAASLLCPGVSEATADHSPYRGVRVLAGGQALRITPRGIRQWTFDPLAPDPALRFDEAAEALRAALATAVHARMAGAARPTTDLSGGLDSTSLAFLAAARAHGRLPAFTYHNPSAPAGDDLACAQHAAALEPRLDHRILTGGAETLAYQELAAAPPSDEPDPGMAIGARTRARVWAVAEASSDLHLTGQGGDVVLGAPLAYLADLARPDPDGWGRWLGTAPRGARCGTDPRLRSSGQHAGWRGLRGTARCATSLPTSPTPRSGLPDSSSSISHGGRPPVRRSHGSLRRRGGRWPSGLWIKPPPPSALRATASAITLLFVTYAPTPPGTGWTGMRLPRSPCHSTRPIWTIRSCAPVWAYRLTSGSTRWSPSPSSASRYAALFPTWSSTGGPRATTPARSIRACAEPSGRYARFWPIRSPPRSV